MNRTTTILGLLVVGCLAANCQLGEFDEGVPVTDGGAIDIEDDDDSPFEPDVRPAKFEPENDAVLVFAGQDNLSVGANAPYTQGYADVVDMPAGITHYLGIQDASNAGMNVPPGKHLAGVFATTDWDAGPICLQCYIDSTSLDTDNLAFHLSISFAGTGVIDAVVDGSSDYLLDELADYIADHSDIPFFLRIGYEFEADWADYSPGEFKSAFKRLVDRVRATGAENFATVMASAAPQTGFDTWVKYYPGNDYVDWLGYSYWGGAPGSNSGSLKFAKAVNKPIMVAESTPRGKEITESNGESLWDGWFSTYFKHIEDNRDYIKAMAYINANWNAQPMWANQGWGDSRIQNSTHVLSNWRDKMGEPLYVTGDDAVHQLIGF